MRLLLVRHGESEGNAAGIVQGHADFGLTARGRAQAALVAAHLAAGDVDRVVASPLLRAAQTAERIRTATGVNVEHDPDLKEHDIGEVSGLSPREIGERYPELIAARRKGVTVLFPGEEPREAFTTRVRGVIDRLAAQDGTTVVVSHGGVVGAAAHYVLGADGSRRGYFSTDNCSITEIVRDRTGRLVLLRFNDTCHLGALSTDFDGG